MTNDAEDPGLEAIAGTIADGNSVDWSGAANDMPPAVLSELQLVERIVKAHRRLASDGDSATTAPPFSADPNHPVAWGHLRIVDIISSGSFGVVYKARDERLATNVALKLIETPKDGDAAWISTALDEAKRLARVQHPNVVRVFGVDHLDGRLGIWMELVEGRTFAQLLGAQGALSAREAANVGLDLTRAVAAVHRVGLVHGDIKASNVMRAAGGRTVLMDFGAAFEPAAAASASHVVKGTPAYVAPEIFEGAELSRASDVYALGVLLFHLVTGEYPTVASTRDDLALEHKSGRRRLLRDVRPDLPDVFVRVVDRALAARPADRYQTPGELEAALARYLDPSPHSPAPERRVSRTRPLALAGLVLLVGLAAWSMYRASDAGGGVSMAASSYGIDAAFYRVSNAGEERLAQGQRLALGDKLSFKLQASVPAFLYIVNEPEQGQPFLLFPLPGDPRQNPLPAGVQARVPETFDWQVTTAGGREHFVVFVSPQRVAAFEDAFARLPSPKEGERVTSAVLPADALERLRSVGGLTPALPRPSTGPRFSQMFTTPLSSQRETAQGLWIRRLTLDNPAP
jgi:eukaryotic-like serine/threonine-protein kinase